MNAICAHSFTFGPFDLFFFQPEKILIAGKRTKKFISSKYAKFLVNLENFLYLMNSSGYLPKMFVSLGEIFVKEALLDNIEK